MTTTQRVSGSKIRDARLNAGMSQAQLAYAIRTGERNIRRWENEDNAPRIDSVAAIARATEQDIAFFLIEGDDEQEAAHSGDPFHGPDSTSPASDRVKRRRGAGPAGVAA